MVFLTWSYLIRFPQVPWVSYLAPSVTICRGTPTDWNVCVKSSPASDFADMCPTWANYLSVTDTCDIVCPLVDFSKEKSVSEYIVQFEVLYYICCCFVWYLRCKWCTSLHAPFFRSYFDCLCRHFHTNASSTLQQAGISFVLLIFRCRRHRCRIPWWQMHLHILL